MLVGEDRGIRILVADSDPRVRSALQTLLRQEAGPILLRESSDMGSLAVQVKEFQPQLVLLQWELPGRPAAELLFALRDLKTRPRIMVLSARPESEQVVLTAGADAFVCKGDPPERLLAAFRGMVQDLRRRPDDRAKA